MARYRPSEPAEAYLRLHTLAGEQAQVDWAHFGSVDVQGGKRKVYAFVMVLSYSRKLFVRFYRSCAMAAFVQGHVQAFEFFSGVCRTLLYDNLKSAVLERVGDAIRFHPTIIELAKHYRFEPKPVNIARGNEKGRVERAIRYVRSSFFAARSFRNVDDLNEQVATWLARCTDQRRCPQEPQRTVHDVFLEEQPSLLPLPQHPFETNERLEAHVGKTPYVRFDRNDYSVPFQYTRQTLSVIASEDTVRIVQGPHIIATHPRSFAVGTQVEDPKHIQDLLEHKRHARKHRGIDYLRHAAPATEAFLHLVAQQGRPLGAMVTGLLRLLDTVGPDALNAALLRATEAGTPHLGALRQLLDQSRGAKPSVSVPVSEDPRVRMQPVRTHHLSCYDCLSKEQPYDVEVQPATHTTCTSH